MRRCLLRFVYFGLKRSFGRVHQMPPALLMCHVNDSGIVGERVIGESVGPFIFPHGLGMWLDDHARVAALAKHSIGIELNGSLLTSMFNPYHLARHRIRLGLTRADTLYLF